MASSADGPALHPDELIDGYERALIGGHLWSPETPLPPLRAEEFFLERHRIVWETLQDMSGTGERPNLPGLVAQLRQRDRLGGAGGGGSLTGGHRRPASGDAESARAPAGGGA